MKIPIDADGVNIPPSQGEQILDEIDVINEQIATIQETLENYETEFNTVNLTAEFISTENIESNTGLITSLDTEEAYAKDFYRKRSRFVEGVGEKFLCNIRKNQRATVYCVNDTQSFAVSFINSSGTIISSIPDAVKTISFYDSLDYIGVYVTQDTDVITHFFVEAEKEAVSFTELNRTLIETRDIIDGISLYGIFNFDIVKTETLQTETIETPSLIKNSVDGTNTFTHDIATGSDRAFVVTPILSGRTEFYITHNGARLATIYVDVLDSGTSEKLVTFSVAQTNVNIIRVILLDNLLAFETNYTEMVDVAYYTETDLIPAPPFSYVGQTGQITPVFATDITSRLRTVMMGNGTTDMGLTIQGELVASVIQLPEGLSFESVEIGDLTITRTATLDGVGLATTDDINNLDNKLTNDINSVNTNLTNHIDDTTAHDATATPIANRIPLYTASAKLTSVLQRDLPITDTGSTLAFDSSGTVNLTNTATTRTISNGLWVGQEVKLFNNTANSITVTDGLFTFTVLSDNQKSVTWSGTRWIDYSIPLGSQYTQRNATDDPVVLFGGVWERLIDLQPELAGRYEREIAAGLVAGTTAEQKLPNIYGRIYEQRAPITVDGCFTSASDAFGVSTKSGGAQIILDASLMNYGTAENPVRIYEEGADVHPNNYIITTWVKTGW